MADKATIREALKALREDIERNDGGFDLTDEELFDTALACLREVQWRIPLSAVQQGDLGPEYGPVAQARRQLADLVDGARAVCFDYSAIKNAN